MFRPVGDRRRGLIDDDCNSLCVDAVLLSERNDVSVGGAAAFTLDVQIVLTAGALREGEVERRRQSPIPGMIHQIGMLPGVIVAIMGAHVENHPPERGLDIIGAARDRPRRSQKQFVTRWNMGGGFDRT